MLGMKPEFVFQVVGKDWGHQPHPVSLQHWLPSPWPGGTERRPDSPSNLAQPALTANPSAKRCPHSHPLGPRPSPAAPWVDVFMSVFFFFPFEFFLTDETMMGNYTRSDRARSNLSSSQGNPHHQALCQHFELLTDTAESHLSTPTSPGGEQRPPTNLPLSTTL